MLDRIAFVVVSSYANFPDERFVTIYDKESMAIKSAKYLNSETEDDTFLGAGSFRVAHVRVTELPSDDYLDTDPLT